jgi:predicted CXXCH cytochrome family protein
MPRNLIKRLLFGICCAALFGSVAVAVSEAGSPGRSGPVRTDCDECHGTVVENWEESAHGMALDDPVFQETWLEKGQPSECLSCHTTGYDPESGSWDADGVTCVSCHEGQTGPHPETAMPTDSSSRKCGTCHIDTHSEWESSAHGEGELACVRCHNPHTTELRAGDMQELCSNCHSEESFFYGSTAHAQRDLSCTDCHLKVSESPVGEGHGQREHTFAVDLDTCNQCHSQEMHLISMDEEADAAGVTIINNPIAGGESCEGSDPLTTSEPESAPASPLNYMLVAAVGLTFGMAVSPVAENWYGRFFKRD